MPIAAPKNQCGLQATSRHSPSELCLSETYRTGSIRMVEDLPTEIADAIEGSKMSPAHDHLDELLDEK
jgi:hypothetical protein